MTGPFAIVPACGHSTRMGRPKLALPLGGRTVLDRVVATLREGGAEGVLVVVGPHVPELVPLASGAGAAVLALDTETADMRATVERGIGWIEEHHHPSDDDWWLLVPGDHPAFTSTVLRQLLAARSTAHSIIVPTHGGRRGHPVLLRWLHAAGIRTHPAGSGINSYLRTQAKETLELPVGDPGILSDMDTMADYERLRASGR
jgi:molybdenum cofactor cytidylyltransferase